MGDDEDLAERVAELERELEALRERMAAYEAAVDEESGTAAEADAGPDNVPGDADRATGVGEASAGPGDSTAGETQRPAEPPGAEPGDDGGDTSPDVVEATVDRLQEVSVTTLLGVAGVVALVVMIGFATQYVIQEELIGRLGQVVAGTAVGLAFWAGGVATARRTAYDTWGWIVAGGGVAVTYYAVYASYGFEAYRDVIDPPLVVVFLALAAVATVAVALSVRERQQVLAGESLLLGFVTVWFVRDLTLAGLGYALLLTLGIAVVVRYRGWVRLTVPAVLGSYGAAVAVLVAIPRTDLAGGVFVGYCLVVFATYLATVLYADGYPISTELTTGINVVGVTWIGFAGFTGFFGDAWEPAAPLVASVGLAVVLAALESGRGDGDRSGLLAGAAWTGFGLAPGLVVLTTTLGVGLQSAFWAGVVAVATVPVATALAIDRHRVRYGWTVVLGLGLWSVLVPLHALEYGGIDAAAPADPAVTYTLLAGALATAAAWWVADREGLVVFDRIPVGTVYAWLFAGVVFVLPVADLSGVELSSAWTLLAIGFLAAGIVLSRVTLRRASFVVFAVTYLKVFFFDTTGLALPQRIVSLFVLGVVLLVASLAYRRFLAGLATDGGDDGDDDDGTDPDTGDRGDPAGVANDPTDAGEPPASSE